MPQLPLDFPPGLGYSEQYARKERTRHDLPRIQLYQLAREINAAGVDLLPFHPFGNSKRTAVGMLSHAEMGKAYIPDADWVERLKGLAYNE